jgi:N-acetylglucosaminyldiphosphoundecaprenol N-acetyl-beta-D-mannosaminyltransferase
MKEAILGYSVDASSVQECVESLFSALTCHDCVRGCVWLACLNPHSYVVALDDPLFASALADADWLVPDGSGVVLASRLLGGRIRERVTGSDVFDGLLQRMSAVGGFGAFFLGATEETLAVIRGKVASDYPGVRVVGTYSPPFKSTYTPAELDAMIDAVNAATPDVLWVGMTAPKQEKWIFENRAKLNVKFAGAIGAVFDFYAGNVKRSPPLFQSLGLEWLPRLVQQPRRLWRRVFLSAPLFMLAVTKERLARLSQALGSKK